MRYQRLTEAIDLLKSFSYKGVQLKKYSFQSYAPHLVTATFHDEQVSQIWC